MIELDAAQVLHVRSLLSVTVGIIILFVGKLLSQRFVLLREYGIPEAVTGGLLCSIVIGAVYVLSGVKVDFDLAARDVLLVYFFAVIGINSNIGDLARGGKPLVALLLTIVVLMTAGNCVGVAAARLLGMDASVGLLAGSISMAGGHGTAAAWAPIISQTRDVPNAAEIGAICATMGLVLASLTGGPVARFLIERHRLAAPPEPLFDIGVRSEPKNDYQIGYFSFLRAILAIHLAAIVGILAHQWLDSMGVKLPLFLPCLAAGIILTNSIPHLLPPDSWPSRSAALALIAEVSLGVFLAMSLMSMKLWTLVGLAGPLAVLVALQLALAVLFAIFVCFRILGRTYDAAVMSGGFMGIAIGTTPVAMANMTAVTQRYGFSHVAFLVVPLLGAFFTGLANALVIQIFLGTI